MILKIAVKVAVPHWANYMGNADTRSATRNNKTICLPFSQQDNNANVHDPVKFRN